MVNPGTIIKLENCLRGMPLLACIQKFRDPHSSFQEKFDVITGADLCVALLELYKLLKAQDVNNDHPPSWNTAHYLAHSTMLWWAVEEHEEDLPRDAEDVL